MDIQKAIQILQTEKECVGRNNGVNCDRQCDKCDLVLPSEDILQAYDVVIDKLVAYEDIGFTPEQIEDIIYRFESLLCYVTNNKMSKCTYNLGAMINCANDAFEEWCDDCEYREL